MAVFHRPALATRLVHNILKGMPQLWLVPGCATAHRKSTFLREDLMPALANAGAKALYVDLWADKRG